jgi:hypothetical protein
MAVKIIVRPTWSTLLRPSSHGCEEHCKNRMVDFDEAVEPWLLCSTWPTLMGRSCHGCDTDPQGRRRWGGHAVVVRMDGQSTWPTSIRWLNHGCTLLMGNVDEAVATMVVIPMAGIDEAVMPWLWWFSTYQDPWCNRITLQRGPHRWKLESGMAAQLSALRHGVAAPG